MYDGRTGSWLDFLTGLGPAHFLGRTATNVAGQALVPTIVTKREGTLDEDAHHAARGGRPVGDSADDLATAVAA